MELDNDCLWLSSITADYLKEPVLDKNLYRMCVALPNENSFLINWMQSLSPITQ